MSTCIRCRGHVEGADGETICVLCAGDIVDNYATWDEVIALAKLGMDALIDEATGYQKIRPADDLQIRLKRYYSERLTLFKDINKKLPPKLNCWETLIKGKVKE